MQHFNLVSTPIHQLPLAKKTVGAGIVMLLTMLHGSAAEEPCAGGSCPSPYTGPIVADEPSCDMWLGPSPIKDAEEHGFGLGVFTGRDIPKGSPVEMEGELLIPIYDKEFGHHPPLREYIWDGELMPEVAVEAPAGAFLFMPGLGGIAPCTDQNVNGEWSGTGNSPTGARHNIKQDSAGAHRSTHPSAGAFAYRNKVTYTAVRDIVAGEELTVKCSDDNFDGGAYYLSEFHTNDNAVACVDNYARVDSSTVAGIGQGLFASRRIAKDSVITSTPLIPIHRKEMDYRIEGRDADGKQLLLNYCYGHPNSDLLLLPYGSLVNYINHAPVTKKANAVIRWHPSDDNKNDKLPRRQQHHHPELLKLSGEAVAETHGKGLMMDIVALRDIAPNEEIFVDYGKDWTDAWDSHVKNWKFNEKDYISASDYNRAHGNEVIRTVAEETYPDNLQTVCYYPWNLGNVDLDENDVHTYWDEGETQHCLRPCVVLERYSRGGVDLYKTKILPSDNTQVISECVLNQETLIKDVPRHAIRIVDAPYTSDVFLENAFRHEIGVPDGFYPETWMKKKMRRRTEVDPEGDIFKRRMK